MVCRRPRQPVAAGSLSMARQVSLLLSAWSAWRRCWRNPDGMGVVYVESARARLPSGPGPIRVSWRGETEPSGQTARARQPHLAADLSFEARGSSCLASHDPRTHPVGCPQNRGAFMAASHLWSLLAPKGLASGQSKPVVEFCSRFAMPENGARACACAQRHWLFSFRGPVWSQVALRFGDGRA